MPKNLFPRRPYVSPLIYAYEEPGNGNLAGLLKIGFTSRDARKRVSQQYPTARPGEPPYKIVIEESASECQIETIRSIAKVNLASGYLLRLTPPALRSTLCP
jgi:hypothetical protein